MPENLLPPDGPARDAELAVARAMDADAVADPTDPDAVRGEIEQTRARMSSTIDELESALLRKKEQIQERLDVLAPLKDKPLLAVGGVFAVGLALGLLTGGDSDAKPPRWFREQVGDGDLDDWKARADDAERRMRRLQRTVASQEREIRQLRGQGGGEMSGAFGVYEPPMDDEESGASALGESLRGLRDLVAEGVAGALHGAFRHRRGEPREMTDDGGLTAI